MDLSLPALPQDSPDGSPPVLPSLEEDAFTSGDSNRLRRWLARLWERLFAPPYLSFNLLAFALLSGITMFVVQLFNQPAAFWIDRSNSNHLFPLGQVIDAGPWVFLAVGLAVALLAVFLLSILHRMAALLGWFLLLCYCAYIISNSYVCGTVQIFHTELFFNCGSLYAVVVGLNGIIFALAVSGALMWMAEASQSEAVTPRLPGQYKAAFAIMTMQLAVGIVGVVSAAAGPYPHWQQIQTPQSPPPRWFSSLAYDTQRQRAVLFGGDAVNSDTWEWDGYTWAQVATQGPPPRTFAGMAYDENRGVTVLFGGNRDDVDYGDTWEWDGRQWTERTPAVSPAPRARIRMAYDPVRRQVVFYGGITSEKTAITWYSEAWAWDGANWTQIPVQPDLKVCCYAFTYHPPSGDFLLMSTDQIYTWSGDRMAMLNAPGGFPARSQSAFVYDPTQKLVIGFGGELNGYANDTWKYDGWAWKRIYTSAAPEARAGHAMFYDPVRGRIVLVGGVGSSKNLNDTWELVMP